MLTMKGVDVWGMVALVGGVVAFVFGAVAVALTDVNAGILAVTGLVVAVTGLVNALRTKKRTDHLTTRVEDVEQAQKNGAKH